MKQKQILSMLLTLVVLLTSSVTAFAVASQGDAAVPGDVKPVKSYTATVGKFYCLPDDVRQSGDTYATSNSKILTTEKDTSIFTPIANGTAYIVITNGIAKRYVKVIVGTATQAAVPTQTPQTWEEKINALTLNPPEPSSVNEDFLPRYKDVQALKTSEMTNYQYLWAVYNYSMKDTRVSLEDYPWYRSCVVYAGNLTNALELAGFDAVYITGECTVKGGGWTKHSWSGIMVNGEVVYLDANIPAEHGGSAEVYFVIDPSKTTIYRNAEIN